MFVLDPRQYLADPQVKPFELDFRSDLTAGDIPIVAAGEYRIARYPVRKGNVLVVKTIVPYAMERTDVGTTTEDFAFIDPLVADGHFLYEPRVNGQAPIILNLDYNAPRIASGTLLNADRIRKNGYSMISNHPKWEAEGTWDNNLFSFVVPADTNFDIVFSILPQGTTNPMPSPYTVPTADVSPERRVDFAGVFIVGLEMSEQTYRNTFNAVLASKEPV